MKNLNNPIVKMLLFIFTLLVLNKLMDVDIANRHKKYLTTLGNSSFSPPTKSPFKHNVGICFNVEATNWFVDSLKYNQALQNKYTEERLISITRDFKLVRIYDFLVAGWEYTGNLSPEAYALTKVTKTDKSVEMAIGTSNNITWYLTQSNVQQFVDTLYNKFGSSIGQVKTILVGNEINANGYSPSQLSTIIGNFKTALANKGLNIPVTVSFSSLPNQQGDALSDSLVAKVMQNWDTAWNSNKPFVFINPYPDGMGGKVSGVFNWQNQVTKYYQTYYPSLQIFIGETGAEGSASDNTTVLVIDSIFTQLNSQYKRVHKTVPTFLFEAVNEPLKPSVPNNQQFMGVYRDSASPSRVHIRLKYGVTLPAWVK